MMQAMVLDRAGVPLRAAELPVQASGPGQILIKVAACGVCRTDLHVFDGALTHPEFRSFDLLFVNQLDDSIYQRHSGPCSRPDARLDLNP